MKSTKKRHMTPAEQSARFREAAKKAGGDQQSFEKAFKKVVHPKKTKR